MKSDVKEAMIRKRPSRSFQYVVYCQTGKIKKKETHVKQRHKRTKPLPYINVVARCSKETLTATSTKGKENEAQTVKKKETPEA